METKKNEEEGEKWVKVEEEEKEEGEEMKM